jgi:hypothetical protein
LSKTLQPYEAVILELAEKQHTTTQNNRPFRILTVLLLITSTMTFAQNKKITLIPSSDEVVEGNRCLPNIPKEFQG